MSNSSVNLGVSIRQRHLLMKIFNSSVYRLALPLDLNFMWNFGSLLGMAMVVQVISGILLAIHYAPSIEGTFRIVIESGRDVKGGWIVRGIHANGASFLFIFMYLHLARGVYYGSYLNKKVWTMGVALLILTMMESFLGYVLVWGQMSFWGATVITNLLSVIPFVGSELVEWIWGGYSIGCPTLCRFYVFHFLFPFMLMAMSIVHLYFHHEAGTKSPLGISVLNWSVPFSPYYLWKDILGIVFMLSLCFGVVTMAPDLFLDPLNNLPADSMKTPEHIQPEWYFLFAYAVLRTVPSKVGGVVLLGFSVGVLFFLPYLGGTKIGHRGVGFSVVGQILFWLFVVNFFVLSWVGSKPVCSPFIEIGMFSVIFYFFYLIFGMNLKGKFYGRVFV